MTIELIICIALAVLIVSMAIGWRGAVAEAEYYRRRGIHYWFALRKIQGAFTPRNNASALKRIAREALEGEEA